MPFGFFQSAGALAARKAVYQEMLSNGYTEEELGYGKALLDHAEQRYLEFRQRLAEEKQP
jgi:hypothetical protein